MASLVSCACAGVARAMQAVSRRAENFTRVPNEVADNRGRPSASLSRRLIPPEFVCEQVNRKRGGILSALPVRAGNPEYVLRAMAIGVSGGDEQEVGEPIGIAKGGGRDLFAGGCRKFRDQPFGAPADSASDMQVGGQRRAPGENKAGKRRDAGVHAVEIGRA